MDDTLLPLDQAYNSGRRSRGNSFNGGACANGALLLPAQPQRHLQCAASAHPDSIEHNTASFLKPIDNQHHRSRHSSFSLNSPVTEPVVAFPDDVASSPFILPAVDFEDNEELDSIFQSALDMSDRHFNGVNQGTQTTGNHFVSPMDRAYQESLQQMLRRSSHSGVNNSGIAGIDAQDQHAMNAMYNGSNIQNLQPANGAQAMRPFDLNSSHQGNAWMTGNYAGSHPTHQQDTRTPHINIIPDTQTPHRGTEVNFLDPFNQSLDVPTPFSDSASFDGGSNYGDNSNSLLADPLVLSRTNSYQSQYQSPHEHLASQPGSPYIAHQNFSMSNHAEHLDQALGHGQQHFSDTLHSQYPVSMHGIPSLHNTPYSYDAPGIAIDPPTPGLSSFSKSMQNPLYDYPQQVPIITTTGADSHHQLSQNQAYFDINEAHRGRSNSDSRLMIKHDRSTSGSPDHRNSSSGSRSPSHSRTHLDVHRSSSRGRISKSGSHSRRSSWSGVKDIDKDLYDRRDSQQSNSKQKNPATFICPVDGCNKAFTRAYNLRSHQRTHTNERPFLCEICGKGFARQHDRKRHEKLHTNEKPFECPGCRKTFARMDALSRHFRSENGKSCIEDKPEYAHYLLDDDGEEYLE